MSKQEQEIHLGIECVLLYMGLVTTTPISRSSLETCQDFALISPKEQKSHDTGPRRHQRRRKSPPAITGIFIKPRLSWKKSCFWHKILPESHEVHRCQSLIVPRVTLQLAQFFSSYIKLENSKAAALPHGIRKRRGNLALITGLHGIREERWREGWER